MSKSQSDNLPVKRVFEQSGFSGKCALILSTWFGVGLLPLAPGTCGTLGAIPFVLLLSGLGALYKGMILVSFTGLAVWVSGRTGKLVQKQDPSMVVIDEVAGFFLTVFFLPLSLMTLGLGFVLFRFFDILKPYPIKKLEKLKGGLGIVIDDLVAGLYAYGVVGLLLLFV
jgi:phosphatidylglycerophosphatase A